MSTNQMAALVLLPIFLLAGCKQGTEEPSTSSSGGLTATPANVRMLPGQNATVSISGGTRPESIIAQPTSSIATASLNDTSVSIHGVNVGSTSVRVGDSSTPQKTVTIGITVATSAVAILFTQP
ncbi:MAG: hypothetical protein HYR76_07680 [Ignavibacteria bacterium]|nr:hypothetical protein [Ignavibacteria bacterium]